MNWQRLKGDIYYEDGSFRDIYVFKTTRDDWSVWANYVNENYKVEFYFYKDGIELSSNKIDIEQVFRLWDNTNEDGFHASIFLDDILIKVHFFSEEEIENDIAPNEINSVSDHIKLVNYMCMVSLLLNKKIILSAENSPKDALISIFKDKVKINL